MKKKKVHERDIDEFKEKLESLMEEYNVVIEVNEDDTTRVCVFDKDNLECFWIEREDKNGE